MHERKARLRTYQPIFGGWTLGRCLFSGDHTAVFELLRTRLDKRLTCALKLIEICPEDLHELQQRFAEAMDELERMELLAPCRHIVRALDDAVYEIRDASGILRGYDLLIRMELLECLADRMRDGDLLSPAETRRLGIEISQALAYAHARGFVHRDVKPANIYRTSDGTFQLGDFGVSKNDAPNHIMRTIAGTVVYMAPEVALGHVYDHRADLYSLGVVLYQLLNHNFLPFTGELSTYSEREEAIRYRQGGALLPLPPDGDPHLQAAVLRACACNAAQRFASAAELCAALNVPSENKARRLGLHPAAVAVLCAAFLSAELFAPGMVQALRPPLPDYAPDFSDETTLSEAYSGQSVLEFIQQPLTWENAKVYCEARGGHLATITSRQEEAHLLSMLDAADVDAVWIGANNRNSSKGFSWVTGERFAYAAWGPNEPNNAGGIEYYLMLMKRDDQWIWNDSRDDGLTNFTPARVGFLCEWDDGDAQSH